MFFLKSYNHLDPASRPLSLARSSCCACAVGSELYVIGGFHRGTSLSLVERPMGRQECAPLQFARCGAAASVVGQRIYAAWAKDMQKLSKELPRSHVRQLISDGKAMKRR